MKVKNIETIYEISSVLLTALIAVSIIFTFFFKLSTVSGQSMENTLQHGDNLLITSLSKEFEIGDVIVINKEYLTEDVLIKRVVAVEGQVVSFDPLTRKLIVDGQIVDEPYIKETMSYFPQFMSGEFVVPEGHLFVMGDNRNHSADSRIPSIGFIDERRVIGKVFYKFGDTELFNS